MSVIVAGSPKLGNDIAGPQVVRRRSWLSHLAGGIDVICLPCGDH